MFGGDYLGQSIWSKTANAPKCGHGGRSIPECVGDELRSIARIGAVTKETLREADFAGLIVTDGHCRRKLSDFEDTSRDQCHTIDIKTLDK